MQFATHFFLEGEGCGIYEGKTILRNLREI